ncbi:hypothetical protein CROQUDRAFT_257521 [Cronartium quercuum f. sp. fusiforme G11]|uniref:Uncharacterized protein n=1 Tax=Cronartium quercuum f. sp. fusiforme G11 TaxID=708437 RepID=A0A9P6T7W5_9BASI|nr:hypothetical protein CROQUDRAFT_257521 [Cronartium quercuum f. sp. fusiforme G11]
MRTPESPLPIRQNAKFSRTGPTNGNSSPHRGATLANRTVNSPFEQINPQPRRQFRKSDLLRCESSFQKPRRPIAILPRVNTQGTVVMNAESRLASVSCASLDQASPPSAQDIGAAKFRCHLNTSQISYPLGRPAVFYPDSPGFIIRPTMELEGRAGFSPDPAYEDNHSQLHGRFCLIAKVKSVLLVVLIVPTLLMGVYLNPTYSKIPI